MSLKLVDNYLTKILLIDGIVRAERGGVVIKVNKICIYQINEHYIFLLSILPLKYLQHHFH